MILDASGDVNIEATIQGIVYDRNGRTYQIIDRRQGTFTAGDCKFDLFLQCFYV